VKEIFIIATLIMLTPEITMAYTACTSNVTRELETCAKINFEESDKDLNIAYKNLLSTLPQRDTDTLTKTQREWISYKETVCQGAYDATFPGEEAGIDKLSCLDQITRARKRELDYLNSGIGGDDFLQAADIVSRFYEHGNRENFISRLVSEFSKDSDAKWHAYVSDNCASSAFRIHDQTDECIARQEFYRR
jgi:uncharacterized protein YecT (DUF1311 family)